MPARIQQAGRRTVLRLLSSALLALPYSPALSSPVSRADARALPGSLGLLPLDTNLLRQAELRMRSGSRTRAAGAVVASFLRDPDNEVAVERFTLQVRSDIAAGRVTTVDGWLVADTELALLASIRHSSWRRQPSREGHAG
jgi:hypothetical protein